MRELCDQKSPEYSIQNSFEELHVLERGTVIGVWVYRCSSLSNVAHRFFCGSLGNKIHLAVSSDLKPCSVQYLYFLNLLLSHSCSVCSNSFLWCCSK